LAFWSLPLWNSVQRATAAMLCVTLLSSSLLAPIALAQTPTTESDPIADLLIAVRRARHPHAPGTISGALSPEEQTAIETQVKTWKSQVESDVLLPNAPAEIKIPFKTPIANAKYFTPDEKARKITDYVKGLSLLTQIRIALGLPHGSKWQQEFSLKIPKAVMDKLPLLGVTSSNRLGDRFYMTVVDRGPDGRADPVVVRLSQHALQGLELAQLVSSPSDEGFLTMVQYLATRQLLQNLSDIQFYRGDHALSAPPIPAALVNKLDSLGLPTDLLQEQRLADAEPRLRLALLDSYAGVSQLFPLFTDEALAKEILKELPPGTPASELIEDFALTEERILPTKLPEALLGAPHWLSVLSEEDLTLALRTIIADKKTAATFQRFVELIENGDISQSADTKLRIMNAIERRRALIPNSISDSAIQGWISAARARAEEESFLRHRSQFIEKLFAGAAELGDKLAKSYDGAIVDPVILARTLAPKLEQLKARATVRGWLSEAASAGGFLSARDRYSDLMAKATTPAVIVEGVVDPARVQLYLETHDFTPKIEFPPTVPPKLASALIKRVTDGRKADVNNLLEVGKEMGFDRLYLSGIPRLKEILTEEEQIERYFDVLESDVLTRYPVLSTEITVPSPGGKPVAIKLYDYLNSINRDHQIGTSQIEHAAVAVEQAMASVERKIHEDLNRVGSATRLEDLETIVQSSLMLSHIMRSYNDFELQRQQEMEKLLLPSLTHQLSHRVLSPYLMWGYGALMLIQIGAAASKRIGYLGWAVTVLEESAPLIRAFESSAVVALLAETSYSAFELYQLGKKKDDAQDFFQASVEGGAFFSYSDTQVLDSEFTKQAWLLGGKVALESIFIYLPAYRDLASWLTLREFKADCQAFLKMGLKPGDWKGLDHAIAVTRSMQTIDQAALTEAERAYALLKGKVKAGKTWSAKFVDGSPTPRTAFEKRLVAARERAAKHAPKPVEAPEVLKP